MSRFRIYLTKTPLTEFEHLDMHGEFIGDALALTELFIKDKTWWEDWKIVGAVPNE